MEPFFFFLLASLLLILILFLIFNCWISLLILLWSDTCHRVLLPVKVKLFKKKGEKIFVISVYSRGEYKSGGDFSRCDAAPAVFHSWGVIKTQLAVALAAFVRIRCRDTEHPWKKLQADGRKTPLPAALKTCGNYFKRRKIRHFLLLQG